MKTILVPTDFSPAAESATKYALELNQKINAKIILFHGYVMPHYAVDVTMVVTDFEDMKREEMDSLKKWTDKYKALYPQMQIESRFADSEQVIANEVSQLAAAENVDLVVMGTTGASGLKSVLFGSNAAAVLEKAPCPVLVIPDKYKFNKMQKIVFATDYQDNDLESLTFLCEIAVLFEAEIIIVHISQTPQTDEYEPDLLEWFKHELLDKANIDYKNLSFHLLIAGDIADELQSYVEKNNVDLVSMSMRKRNTFSKLFSRSVTKTLAHHTRTPLLAFHAAEFGN